MWEDEAEVPLMAKPLEVSVITTNRNIGQTKVGIKTPLASKREQGGQFLNSNLNSVSRGVDRLRTI